MSLMSTKVPGVRFREHPNRKFRSRKDRYYTIRYTFNGRTREEGLGWRSEGWSEKKAIVILYELKFNQTIGKGDFSLAQKRANAFKKTHNLKLAEIFEGYMKQSKLDKAKSTWQREVILFNKWIKPHLGNVTLEKLDLEAIDTLKRTMQEATQAPRSICYAISLIRQLINYSRKVNLFNGEDPTCHVKKPKVDNRRIRFLSRRDARILLDKLKQKPALHAMALISLHCGLRAGEILNLTWGDVNLDAKQIAVKDTKSKKNRISFITSEVREELKKLRSGQRSGFIFKTKNGNKYEKIPIAFKKAVCDLRLNKGISDRRQKVVFHTLRHTYASWLVMSGIDLYTVQQLMGHSSISMTERYSHLAPNYLKRAVKIFESGIKTKKINYQTNL